jgi:tartrate dehydratase alpha subunit/fumarate hydratase class I-like protein
MANVMVRCDMLDVSSIDINACSPLISTFGIGACIAKSYLSMSRFGVAQYCHLPR